MSKRSISKRKLTKLIETIVEEEQENYQKVFKAVMDKFGINSPDELQNDKDKEKIFYNTVDSAYAKLEDGDSVEDTINWVKDQDVNMSESKQLRRVIRKMIEAVLDGDDTRAGAKRFGSQVVRSKAQKRGAGVEIEDEDELVAEVFKRVTKRLVRAKKRR